MLRFPVALSLLGAWAVASGPAYGQIPVDEYELRGPNMVVIVVDDMGVDMVSAYGEAPVAAPCTPNIDQLAATGLLFRNAWTNPICSPTRAQILTGRHAFRNTVGGLVQQHNGNSGLPVSETILPEALPAYASSAVGKWHLAAPIEVMGDGQGLLHPNNSGFGYFAGSMYNLGQGPVSCPTACTSCPAPYDYFDWIKTINGAEGCSTTYATTDTADEAILRATVMPEPWFLYVAFNAAHIPVHWGPASLCPGLNECICTPPTMLDHPSQVKTMAEALDTEIGRMVAAIRALDEDVIIFLIGDNGTAVAASEGVAGGCFDPARVKGTLYEGGVNVPFIISAPFIVPREVTRIVSSTDIFATVAGLAGYSSAAEDSVSLVPYMYGSTQAQRGFVYAEKFSPNGPISGATTHQRTIRNRRFKLIRRTDQTGQQDELYDLTADPCESTDLYPPAPGSLEDVNYQMLVAELVAMGVG